MHAAHHGGDMFRDALHTRWLLCGHSATRAADVDLLPRRFNARRPIALHHGCRLAGTWERREGWLWARKAEVGGALCRQCASYAPNHQTRYKYER
jgi:hypothetical protein